MNLKSIQQIHKGSYLSYYELNYTGGANDEHHKTYEIVSRSKSLTSETLGKKVAAVVMIAVNKEHDKLLVLKEFRLGINDFVYNFPAGIIDDGETAIEAAIRELREETGLTLTKIIKELPPSYLCAPVIDELTTVIVCEAEGTITNSDSPDEEIYASWFTIDEMKNMMENGEFKLSGRVQAFCYGWVYGF